MNIRSLNARTDRLFTAVNSQSDTMVIDVTGVKESLLHKLEESIIDHGPTPTTIDNPEEHKRMLDGLKNVLKEKVEHSKARGIRFISQP